jgi:hypothetical protein
MTSTQGVPGVLAIEPHRPFSERERVILAEVEAENDPLILEALRMFNATVAGIEPSDNFTRANFTPHWCNGSMTKCYVLACVACGWPHEAKRRDAVSCSPKCRV